LAPAIRTASQTWAAGNSQFISAIKLQKERVDALYTLINISRSDIRAFNNELLGIIGEEDLRTALVGLVINMLKKTIFQVSQLDGVYRGLEDLVRRQLSHYIVSHDELNRALHALQNHLLQNEPELRVAEMDVFYYYAQGVFKIFRYKNHLVINLRVPLTTRELSNTFSVFQLIPVLLAGPEIGDKHYTVLKTDISDLVYNEQSRQFVVIHKGDKEPHDLVWNLPETNLVLQSRDVKTCASALIEANLQDIKKFCGYEVVCKELPPSSIRLSTDKILVSNQENVLLKCRDPVYQTRFNESQAQYIVHVNCHCNLHVGSLIFLNEGLHCENLTEFNDSSTTFVFYMLNIPYLSGIFPDHWISNVQPDLLFNETILVQVPNLLVHARKVEDILIGDGRLTFDLDHVLNKSLKSEAVFNSLSDYLFDQVVKAKGLARDVNLLSWQTWLEFVVIFIVVINVVWTIVIHFRVKNLYALLAVVPRASAYPYSLIYFLPTEASKTMHDSSWSYKEILNKLREFVPMEILFISVCIIVL